MSLVWNANVLESDDFEIQIFATSLQCVCLCGLGLLVHCSFSPVCCVPECTAVCPFVCLAAFFQLLECVPLSLRGYSDVVLKENVHWRYKLCCSAKVLCVIWMAIRRSLDSRLQSLPLFLPRAKTLPGSVSFSYHAQTQPSPPFPPRAKTLFHIYDGPPRLQVLCRSTPFSTQASNS